MRFSDRSAVCRCRQLDLNLAFVDFDPDRDEIQWRWRLIDERLPSGETFLHVSTDRCGWNMRCH
ncbi:MAG: hypothetical protein Q8K79_10925, partial [Solirubrobacteraceae bacterium]|nr:hypothetical protein [Solirubrobacteraceae bacterium]